MYVYKKSVPGIWTVGFFEPMAPGEVPPNRVAPAHLGLNYMWHPTRDCATEDEAQQWTSYLNGGTIPVGYIPHK